jgi:hypothetical protein
MKGRRGEGQKWGSKKFENVYKMIYFNFGIQLILKKNQNTHFSGEKFI